MVAVGKRWFKVTKIYMCVCVCLLLVIIPGIETLFWLTDMIWQTFMSRKIYMYTEFFWDTIKRRKSRNEEREGGTEDCLRVEINFSSFCITSRNHHRQRLMNKSTSTLLPFFHHHRKWVFWEYFFFWKLPRKLGLMCVCVKGKPTRRSHKRIKNFLLCIHTRLYVFIMHKYTIQI